MVEEEEDPGVESCENYPSASEPSHSRFLLGQFTEDVAEGMMLGPYDTDEEIAALLGVTTSDLVVVPQAVRVEALGKLRAIGDATKTGQNNRSLAHIAWKGSCPAAGDAMHAMASSRAVRRP